MKVALAGDTMLGRGVAERIEVAGPDSLVDPEVAAVLREADRRIVNLECCVSAHGAPTAGRVFHFRAPPSAVDVLAGLGVDCVTLANNHALDFGPEALVDTFGYLEAAGIPWAGAGADLDRARAPVLLENDGFRLAVIATSDHPAGDAATPDRPGIAFADLRRGVPSWLADEIGGVAADAVLVAPHWGPNMTPEPVPHVRAAAPALLEAGATLIAGHSAHVFHGLGRRVLYDLGDFVDDYAVDRTLRNDLGLLVVVDLAGDRLEALPLKLDYAHTRLAEGEDFAWVRDRFRAASAAFGTDVAEVDGRLVARWR